MRTIANAVRASSPGGTIVLIGSIADTIGVYGYGTYAASKAALRSYARTWTAERTVRGNRQGAAQLTNWLPRLR